MREQFVFHLSHKDGDLKQAIKYWLKVNVDTQLRMIRLYDVTAKQCAFPAFTCSRRSRHSLLAARSFFQGQNIRIF